MTTTNHEPARVSATSLPVRQLSATSSDGGATDGAPPSNIQPATHVETLPTPPRQRGRPPNPAAAATRAGASVEPDGELLEELGRLFWNASKEGGTPAEVATRVTERLQAAKRLGELATLLGVE